jgi:hypothetical protein
MSYLPLQELLTVLNEFSSVFCHHPDMGVSPALVQKACRRFCVALFLQHPQALGLSGAAMLRACCKHGGLVHRTGRSWYGRYDMPHCHTSL